jgi:hypothetical protein
MEIYVEIEYVLLFVEGRPQGKIIARVLSTFLSGWFITAAR